MNRFIFIVPIVAMLAACTQSTGRLAGETPQSVMTRVAKQAQACWFKGNDRALAGFRMAPELNSFSGKPRILIVPANQPSGLPKLVAQAERQSGQTAFTAFGPLLDGPDGARLRADLSSWAGGSRTC